MRPPVPLLSLGNSVSNADCMALRSFSIGVIGAAVPSHGDPGMGAGHEGLADQKEFARTLKVSASSSMFRRKTVSADAFSAKAAQQIPSACSAPETPGLPLALPGRASSGNPPGDKAPLPRAVSGWGRIATIWSTPMPSTIAFARSACELGARDCVGEVEVPGASGVERDADAAVLACEDEACKLPRRVGSVFLVWSCFRKMDLRRSCSTGPSLSWSGLAGGLTAGPFQATLWPAASKLFIASVFALRDARRFPSPPPCAMVRKSEGPMKLFLRVVVPADDVSSISVVLPRRNLCSWKSSSTADSSGPSDSICQLWSCRAPATKSCDCSSKDILREDQESGLPLCAVKLNLDDERRRLCAVLGRSGLS
mmetsp:Transcript_49379/g.107535  ORF Transcript_49379/g.107535 Transcript_49379/m.107535 type:complete len:368 (+) Transcript_49379:517-1620(+)